MSRELISRRPIQIISNNIRHFASKKNAGKKNSSIGESDVAPSFSFDSYEKQMSKAVNYLKSNLEHTRIGRANPSLLDKVTVPLNGKKMMLPSIAQIHAKDTQTLMVVMTDGELTNAVDKSLRQADLGLNPQKIDSFTLSVPLPKVTGDARLKLIKSIKDTAEKSKVSVRLARKDARTDLSSLKKLLSADSFRKHEKEIDAKTEVNIKSIDTLVAAKEKEISNSN